ncbi:MAG TPA: PQQ-binding-like beta-propeller repeat protein [Phycisphaerae bacterium]|nr:PQQ-binding-like beta-propeller repeat protein [Phycisphaerae bacterium]HUU21000.1 PQQ-binding-like beta-propeller repeat protein [Phycisphaerae bacterium]
MGRSNAAVAVCMVLAAACWAHAQPVVGWRTDGTGRYPDADPPITWSAQENVVWKTPMPDWSNATPVVVGERIFVCSEPADLICVRASDGEVMWRRPNGYEQYLSPEEAAKVKEDLARAKPIRQRYNAARKASAEADREWKKAPDDPAVKAKADRLKKEAAALAEELEPLTKYAPPKASALTGYSTPTPVSDGRFVYVHTGLGTTACYDLDGNRKWIAMTDKPRHDWAGHSNSPLLADGKLIVHVVDATGLDAATGRELWRTKSRWHDIFGSPISVNVGGTAVLVSPGGDAIRVADGRTLAREMFHHEFAAPVAEGRVVYSVGAGDSDCIAIQLPEEGGEELAPRVLWRKPIRKDRYYASPLIHDGLIYAVTRRCVLSVLDAADGTVVYEKKLEMGGDPKDEDQVFASVTLAGGNVYVSHRLGTTVVLAAGREYRQLAVNKLEEFRACPVFVGRRMYVRGMKHLWCIGR